jgi:phosphate transport system substrate-binding protein
VNRRIAAVLAVLLVVGCGTVRRSDDRVVAVRGSDTMLILNRRLAETFMRSHPGASVVVDGGGTSAGVDALINGEVTIAAASRPLEPEEVQRLYDRHGTLGVRFLVARDALSVWVDPSNPVTDLSIEQLAGIFTGELTSWRSVGGGDLPITVVVRPPASGTHRLFRDLVLSGAPYSPRAVVAVTTREVVARVAGDPSAVGYGGEAYDSDAVRACAVDGALPTAAAVADGRYPLTRHLVLATVAPPRGLTRDFIDWCQGPEGQKVVAEVGYLPLWRQP